MAKIPDNIVYIMAVDNAGNVVNIDADLLKGVISQQAQPASIPEKIIEKTIVEKIKQIPSEQKESLKIDADPNYITKVGQERNTLVNSIVYEKSKKIGINTKTPAALLHLRGGSINIETKQDGDGLKIDKYNALSFLTDDATNELYTIILGDDDNIVQVSLYDLIIRSQILEGGAQLTQDRILMIDNDGLVTSIEDLYSINGLVNRTQVFATGTAGTDFNISSVTDTHTFNFPDSSSSNRGLLTSTDWSTFNDKFDLPTLASGSVIFSNGTTLVQDNSDFFYDANTHTLKLTHLASTGSAISAASNWTFGGTISVPTPTSSAHAATKQYVDDLALTGLKIGAPVKTVSLSNITLSGNQTIEGYTTSTGDRVLVTAQSTANQNGVYVTDTSSWTRATDSDSDSELRGYQYLIEGATSNEFGARYGNTNTSVITIGTTSVTYQKIASGESDPVFTAHPSYGIDATDISNWDTAYNDRIVSIAFSSPTSTTRRLTLTQGDSTSLNNDFTIPVISVTGSTNRINVSAVSGTYQVDISGSYAGQSTITTVGTIGTGVWQGTAISDAYIASASTWNAKQNAITLTTTGTSGAATLVGSTLNIPIYQGGVTSFNTRTGAVVPAEGDYDLTELGDVTITSAATGQLLRYNGTQWANWTPNYITSLTDTLATVTARGATTSTQIGITNTTDSTSTITGALIVSGGIGVAKKLYVGSTITSESTVTATAFYESSDIRFKNIIERNPYIDLSSLDTIKFTRDGDLDKDIRYGYSAQDVRSINSDFVKEDEEGKLFVNYIDVHTMKIAQLEQKIKELEEKLSSK